MTVSSVHRDGITDGYNAEWKSLIQKKQFLSQLGKETLGRVFNVLGDTIDLSAPFPEDAKRSEIHKKAPNFDELSTSTEIP